jgi:formylglycine-generating enzyme required for sulfatase activity
VINVSWDDAQVYAAWLSKMTGKSYRLLTEAEWEYAARAGSTTVYFWGDEIKKDGKPMANCAGCGSPWDDKRAAPVGQFPANDFGMHDMSGNVWEWVEDCYVGNYDQAPTDGSARTDGDCNLRLARGGSWGVDPDNVRSARRIRLPTSFRLYGVGFRVARMLTP